MELSQNVDIQNLTVLNNQNINTEKFLHQYFHNSNIYF